MFGVGLVLTLNKTVQLILFTAFLLVGCGDKAPQEEPSCETVAEPTKALILSVGRERAEAMNIRWCGGCLVASDSLGEIVLCE